MKLQFPRNRPRHSFAKILVSMAFVIGVGWIAGRLQKKGLKSAFQAVKDAVPTRAASSTV
jgi:hypothetical protein